MAVERTPPPTSPEGRVRVGRDARAAVPHEMHADLTTGDRQDPVQVVAGQAASRLADLVPIRHARMVASPFAFFRGAAAVMAGDLARTPSSGLTAQLCGDAHLSNFGTFASPERNLLFDINDFDETFPGPWEWDVKRLAASLAVAGRENSFSGKRIRKIVVGTVRRYQEAMKEFAGVGNLEVWYARVHIAEERQRLGSDLDKATARRLDKGLAKARERTHLHSLAKLTEVTDGRRRIVADPPMIVPVSDLMPGLQSDEIDAWATELVRSYSLSLGHGPRELVRSFEFVDMARKVVGVGSVGTRCWIVLMRGRDENDPLFLQVKEAQRSVLEAHLGRTAHRSEGARVVAGQRIMQAAGDIFLGWKRAVGPDGVSRDFYIRQLHDWKGSAQIETMEPGTMRLYGQLCAWTLARAHARSGDRIAIAAYLGDDDTFARAIADFADSYADLNEQDFKAMAAAVQGGELVSAPSSLTSPAARSV